MVGTSPRVVLIPTSPPNAAGTRPEPAVSVPMPMSAMPSATATAEPELDPPDDAVGQRGVPDGAERAADADEPRGELVEVGLAEDHGSGVDQRLDGRSGRLGGDRSAGGVRRERRARGRRRQGCDVDVVLDREREPGQREHRTRREPGIDLPGGGDRGGLGQQGDPHLGAVDLGDPGVRAADAGLGDPDEGVDRGRLGDGSGPACSPGREGRPLTGQIVRAGHVAHRRPRHAPTARMASGAPGATC